MKKIFAIGLCAIALVGGLSLAATAQEKQPEKKTEMGKALQHTGNAISKGAKAVGNKTSEVASKSVSKVADKTYEGKVAPDGSNVYIDGKNKKYYVNKQGKHIYLKESEIKNKPKAKK